jgi:hypothetical protein
MDPLFEERLQFLAPMGDDGALGVEFVIGLYERRGQFDQEGDGV